MKKIIISTLLILACGILPSCTLFDDGLDSLVVCSRGINAGETFTLWGHGGSIEAENGRNAGYRVTDEAIVALGDEAYIAESVIGSLRWAGSKPSEFYAATDVSVPVDAMNGIYGPAEIPSQQRWEQVYKPVPMFAGPMMTERGLPLVMIFSQAVSVVTLAVPPLAEGVSLKEASVWSSTEAVCGIYSVEFVARKVSAAVRSDSTAGIRMEMQDAVPSSDGWIYIRFLLIPHRYHNLSYSLTLMEGDMQHVYASPLMDEPYGHTMAPFCKMMVNVTLPQEYLMSTEKNN